MSDTPRMESAAGHAWGIVDAGILTEGMKLERELNAANERIKQLEEAGDAMAEWLFSPRNLGGDSCLVHQWNEAKEAKP